MCHERDDDLTVFEFRICILIEPDSRDNRERRGALFQTSHCSLCTNVADMRSLSSADDASEGPSVLRIHGNYIFPPQIRPLDPSWPEGDPLGALPPIQCWLEQI
jgi:hypothetical protein